MRLAGLGIPAHMRRYGRGSVSGLWGTDPYGRVGSGFCVGEASVDEDSLVFNDQGGRHGDEDVEAGESSDVVNCLPLHAVG